MAKIEEQVLTIEQMNHIKELGVEVEDTALALVGRLKYEFSVNPHTLFEVEINKGDNYPYNGIVNEFIPTLNLQEILELLPEEIRFEDQRAFLILDKEDRQISYTAEDYGGNLNIDCIFFENKSLLQASYNMLCWCAENEYLNKE